MQQNATMMLKVVASCYYTASQQHATTTLQSNEPLLQQTAKEFMYAA
jgi:hypothetical protein